tara:strand:- start:154 stop:882 length:729 start_codon:yes stop_codon:yes gene_type:complete
MTLNGKIALITGGSSGIGKSIAKSLSSKGARVFCAQRKPSEHEDILEDLTDKDAPKRIVDKLISKTGQLDILINNAGIMKEGKVCEITLEEWEEHIQLNLTTPFLMIKSSIDFLKISSGSIVNIGSIEGLGNNPRHPAYGASKAGLHGLTRAIAVDYGEYGIRCNAIAPGWIDTPLNNDFIKSFGDEKAFKEKLRKIHPIGRTGTPKEVANLVSWLASEEASFVTGQVWTIDGGRMAKLSLT